MANIARFDPFNIMRTDPFEDVMRDFMTVPYRSMLRRTTEPAVPVDIQETDKAYLLTAELPGIKKEDIEVSITENQVTISAEVKQEKEAGGEAKSLCSERWYGKVSRTVQLPLDIDEKGADAICTDGVLHLTLPKKASSQAKRLMIH